MGWMSASGRDTVASEDEAMAEDVRAPSAGVTSVEDEATSVSGFHDEDDDDDDDGGASWPEEEALSLDSVGSHSSEDELETINSVQNAAVNNSVADEDEQSLVSHQLRRKRSRPGSSFSSDDDDEVSDILLSAEGGGVDVDEDSSTGPASVAPVQFSATPPQDLPRPGRVLAASTTNSTTSSSAASSLIGAEKSTSTLGGAAGGSSTSSSSSTGSSSSSSINNSSSSSSSSSSGSRPPPPKTLHFNDGAAVLSRRATLSTSSSEGMGFHRPSTTSSTPTTQRQATDSSRVVHAARQPRPFLDFDKMRQKAAHALTSWKHGSELTLACR